MPPVLVGRYRGDVTGDEPIQAPRAQRDHASASKQPAPRGPLLDREHDEFDRLRQIEVVVAGLVLAAAPWCRRLCTRIGDDAQPRAIRCHVAGAGRPRGHLHVGKPDAVLASVVATAQGDQASSRVAVVLDRDEHQGLPDDMDVERQRDGGLDRTVQRPELCIIVAGLADDLGQEAFAVQRLAARVSCRGHEVRGLAGGCFNDGHAGDPCTAVRRKTVTQQRTAADGSATRVRTST